MHEDPTRQAAPPRARSLASGFLLATAMAAVLLGHWGMQGKLTRDAAVYAYAGQQLFHGVPPYVSIFDPKGPLAAMLAAVGAALATWTGHAELSGIRLVYGVTSCLAAGVVYLVARRLFGGAWSSLAAPVALCAFPALAANAFSGPEAKTPALLCLLLLMLFALSERWALSGVCAGLACLAWQPMVVVVVVIALAARLQGRTLRFLAWFAVPMLACLLFFVITRSLDDAFDASVRFPLSGVEHSANTVVARLDVMASVLVEASWVRGVLAVVGFVALFATLPSRAPVDGPWSRRLRAPEVSVVLWPALALLAYCLVDFQGTPDLIPLLPFAALGFAGLADSVRRVLAGRVGVAVVGASIVGLIIAAWVVPSGFQSGLGCQQAQASAISSAAPGTRDLWAFGDPAVLVLTERRNPDRFVYLASGAGAWKVEHDPDGLDGWAQDIIRVDPQVAVFGGFNEGDIARDLKAFFVARGYVRQPIGTWTTYRHEEAAIDDSWRSACG